MNGTDGKTYCVIAALTFMRTKSMIITHTDLIKNQWKSSLIKMTNLDERQILNIDGSATIKKIMKTDKLPYKVYLVNHRTIHSYAKKHGWEAVAELFKKLKIGVKVFDEAHLEFENLIKTDLHTNTKKTIYLTANFERSEYKQNKLFQLCFKNIPKYGLQTRKEKRKHIIYIPVFYNSKPNIDQQAGMKGLHGFDKNKYCDYIMDKDKFFEVLQFTIDYVKKYEGKILVLTSKIDSTETVRGYLSQELKDKSVGVYNSKISEEEKHETLNKDVISSTPKSLGTGTDVPGLRTVIMTEPYSSSNTANQTSGRLREYGPEDYTIYMEIIDTGFPQIVKMYKKRLPGLKKKCVQVFELKYDQ